MFFIDKWGNISSVFFLQFFSVFFISFSWKFYVENIFSTLGLHYLCYVSLFFSTKESLTLISDFGVVIRLNIFHL